jgi:integrase
MTVYRHRDKWRYDFWKNGVRQRESGFNTKQEAKAAEAEARKRLKKMNSDFISLCESRLRDVKERRTEKYFNENKALIEKLTLEWASKKEITRKDVEDYLAARAKKSHTLANRELRMIKALFEHGLEREMLSDNPAGRIKFYSVSKSKKYIPPREDIQKVLEAATPRQRQYLLAIIHTLARVNEINKLKWEDVHEDYLILRTRKSKNSDLTERKIPLNETLKEILDSLPRAGEYVFCYKATKKPYGYRRKMILRACKKAKVREFTFHALRHYGASRLANSGVPIPDIQALLGHQRSTTTDIYLQSISPNLRKAMDNLDIDSPT